MFFITRISALSATVIMLAALTAFPAHADNMSTLSTSALTPKPKIVDMNGCTPIYPTRSREDEQEGTVRIQFEIDANDQVVAAKIVKSSGFKLLDLAAVGGLSRCKFKAAVKDGKPVQSSFTVDYAWELAHHDSLSSTSQMQWPH